LSNNAVSRKPPEDINGWMCNYLARKLNVAPDKIDTRESFDTFGLDSADAVRMIGDLEDFLGRRLSPSLAYKYPTIESMSRYLADGKS
jgi:acyl carrier protein